MAGREKKKTKIAENRLLKALRGARTGSAIGKQLSKKKKNVNEGVRGAK